MAIHTFPKRMSANWKEAYEYTGPGEEQSQYSTIKN